MIGRIFWTALALLCAAGGFLGAAPLPAGPLNAFGIVFLTLSGIIWFGWGVIPDIYAYHEEIAGSRPRRLDLVVLRMAPLLAIKSMQRRKPGAENRS